MDTTNRRSNVAWGGLLILLGLMILVQRFIHHLSPWIWAVALFAAGLAVLALFGRERAHGGLTLIQTYVLWAVALLIVLGTFRFLPGAATSSARKKMQLPPLPASRSTAAWMHPSIRGARSAGMLRHIGAAFVCMNDSNNRALNDII